MAGLQIHLHIHDERKTDSGHDEIIQKLNQIMANEQQALQDLDAIKTTLTKISTESTASLQKITELEAAANEANVPQSVLDKIAEVRSLAQGIDDLVPDAPTTPVTE